jgi:hypothetical protein
MQFRFTRLSPWLAVLLSAGMLALAGAPALGQQVAWGGHQSCQPAPCPFPETAPPPAIQPAPVVPTPPTPAAPEAAQPPSTDLTSLDQRFAGTGGETVSVPNMIGDLLLITSSSSSRYGPQAQTNVIGRASTFKIANDQNAAPQDRVFFNFDYFNDVNHAVNFRNGVDIGKIDIYTYTWGFEKTFLDRNASIGLFIPLNRVNADNGVTPGTGGDFQDIGDLTVFGKYVLWRDRDTGSLLTGGLGVSAPTGPRNLAGAPDTILLGFHDTLIQPFLAYRFISGNWYIQGFEEITVPTDSNDFVLLFNDIGTGYFLLRDSSEGRWLTAIVPTFEFHLNDPLNHRGSQTVPLGLADWAVLTQGVILEFNRRSLLTFGVCEPITGPRPYAVEGLVQFNFLF